VTYPENLVSKLANFDVFWGHLEEALFTTGPFASVTATRMGTLLLTHHS
jgi:hypothetical protein